mmetsp:Transcript_35037/g.116119  ORF Transcript_35037/g.116119 Transcript_35037/m.116119 type:complete len:261 (-) Transcript_35037:8-790(-)
MPRARAVMLCLTLVVGIDAGSPRPPHPRAPRRPGLAAERSRICCQQEPAPPPLTAFALASAPAAAAAAVGEGWFVAVLAPFLLLANTVEAPPFAALLRRRLSLPRLVSPPRAPVLPHCLSASSPPVLLPHTPSSTCRSHGHCVAALRCLPSPPQRGARVRRGRGSAQPPGGTARRDRDRLARLRRAQRARRRRREPAAGAYLCRRGARTSRRRRLSRGKEAGALGAEVVGRATAVAAAEAASAQRRGRGRRVNLLHENSS